MARSVAAVAAILILLAGPARAASLAADLQDILARYLAENPTAPGICAYVECPALGLRWAGAAGTVARGSAQPLTAAHTFRLASNTKTYTAAAVLRLAEDGRLDLDAPLTTYLTEAERALLASDGYDLGAITLHEVLSHTAGLAEHCADDRYADAIVGDPQHRWTRDEQLQLCVEWFDPVGAPGEQFHYSDTGYVLLGAIIERTTGRNLGAAVRDLLDFRRLGLTATWWEYLEEPPAAAGPRAHQYYSDQDVTDWHASFDLYGGGGIVSDAREMAVFMRALLKGRVLHQEATLAAMTGGGTPSYRLGLMCVNLDGRLAWGHQGFWNTFAYHVPSLDLTVAGSILDHDALNGRALADALVARVARARDAE